MCSKSDKPKNNRNYNFYISNAAGDYLLFQKIKLLFPSFLRRSGKQIGSHEHCFIFKNGKTWRHLQFSQAMLARI